MSRRSSIRVDAITHRFEMPILFLVRVRRDSSRTLDYAITNASVGVEKRVYLQRVAARSGSFPLRRSFLGPTASHFGAEGPRHRERNPAAVGQTFPARWHFLQPCCQRRRRTRRTPLRYILNYILNYTPPICSLHGNWLTRAEDISGGPNMTVQCKG